MVIAEGRNGRKVDNDVLTVRAHQLRHLAWAMGLGKYPGDPDDVAYNARLAAEEWLEGSNPADRKYAQGIIGRRGQHADVFEASMRVELERLVSAPEETTVEIVDGLPGSFCRKLRSCGLGEHCLRRFVENEDGSRFEVGEVADFNTFLQAAEIAGVEEKLQIEITKAVFSDGPSKPARKIRTTAGMLRAIIRTGQRLY